MIGLHAINQAAQRLQGQVLATPCVQARSLSAVAGCRIFLKFENLQLTASFKERGACNKLMTLVAGGGAPRGVIAGMALALKALKPTIEVIGVQAMRFPAMYNAFKHQHRPQGRSTIAEGIAVGTPGRLPLSLIERRVDDIALVDEDDIEQAILMLLEQEKTLVEGAGAAGLAAVLQDRARFAGRNVGLVLCGGNIDPLLLAAIIHRAMVRAGRLVRLRVGARDVPGSLAQIAATVAQAGGNVEEVHHQRAFTSLSAQNVDIELVVQTRGPAHVGAVLEALHGAGFDAAQS